MELKFDPENPVFSHIINQDQANKALDDLEKEKL